MKEILIFVALVLSHVQISSLNFTFAQVSDIHNGNGNKELENLQAIVSDINSKQSSKIFDFVIVTGDLVHNGLEKELLETKAVLDQLTIPYFPLLGNHDIWGLDETKPEGDYRFFHYFGDMIKNNSLVSDYVGGEKVFNPHNELYVFLQNYVISYNNFKIIVLDWNSRNKHILMKKRSAPGADLFDFEKGTYQWLEDQLTELSKEENINTFNQLAFAQHQSFWVPFYIPSEYHFCFDKDQKEKVFELLDSFPKLKDKFYGVFDGHIHAWHDDIPFEHEKWMDFKEHVTTDVKAKQDYLSIQVDNGFITKTERIKL